MAGQTVFYIEVINGTASETIYIQTGSNYSVTVSNLSNKIIIGDHYISVTPDIAEIPNKIVGAYMYDYDYGTFIQTILPNLKYTERPYESEVLLKVICAKKTLTPRLGIFV